MVSALKHLYIGYKPLFLSSIHSQSQYISLHPICIICTSNAHCILCIFIHWSQLVVLWRFITWHSFIKKLYAKPYPPELLLPVMPKYGTAPETVPPNQRRLTATSCCIIHKGQSPSVMNSTFEHIEHYVVNEHNTMVGKYSLGILLRTKGAELKTGRVWWYTYKMKCNGQSLLSVSHYRRGSNHNFLLWNIRDWFLCSTFSAPRYPDPD